MWAILWMALATWPGWEELFEPVGCIGKGC